MGKHYAVTVIVEAKGREEAREFGGTFGARSGLQWDKPLVVCGEPIVFETSDPASREAGDMSTSDGLGAIYDEEKRDPYAEAHGLDR